MKKQRIPEHQLNVTATVDQAIENMTNNDTSNGIATEKTHEGQVHSNEAK